MTTRNIFALLIAALLTSCSGQSDNDKSGKQAADIASATPSTPTSSCYAYQTGQDSALLRIDKLERNDVAGKLSYAFFEKDRNQGTFEGTMRGDTIFAHYTFRSEGSESVREVIFLKNGEDWVEGFGELKDSAGIMIFADRSRLNFEKGLHFKHVECPVER